MSLSELNLHCVVCRQLTLHTMFPPPKLPITAKPEVEVPGVRVFDVSRTTRPRFTRNDRRRAEIDALADEIRDQLDLVDFDVFAADQNNRYMAGPYPWDSGVGRRTGRTWRGLVRAFAECLRDNLPTMIVCGTSAAHELEMRELVRGWRQRLGVPFPRNVLGVRRSLNVASTYLFVDHAVLDRGTGDIILDRRIDDALRLQADRQK